jgi:hypothetical protein
VALGPNVAKEPFHVNDKYPIKLKLKDMPGIKYESPTIGKDAAEVDAFAKFRGKRHPKTAITTSVCTEDKCLLEKQESC